MCFKKTGAGNFFPQTLAYETWHINEVGSTVLDKPLRK